ncbi:MAG TPA: alpha/beta fold hydrolase, partial [Deltaproteobacteria bacterium]|nr:alpha/beta fold hydrolase [Deltaproteobacteria bacterium]
DPTVATNQLIDLLGEHRRIDAKRIGAFGFSSGGTAVLECSLVEPGIQALITLDATVRPVSNIPDRIGIEVLSALGRIKRLFTGTGLQVSLVGSCAKMEVASDPEINAAWGRNPRVIEMWSAFPFPGTKESTVVDTIRRVHDIKVPTLVLHGAEDKIDKPESARLLYGTLTCTKGLHIIEGNGHLGHMDRNKRTVMELTAGWALKHLR